MDGKKTIKELLQEAEYPAAAYSDPVVVVEALGTSIKEGLRRDLSSLRREQEGLNLIPPPHNFPDWLCCLLPCILATDEMAIFHECIPESAEVRIGKMWIQTDANSLVRGDIVRLMKGDRIPADARLVKVGEGFCCDDSVLLGGRDGDSSAGQHQLIYKPGDLVFCSSYITEGKAHAVIIATGQHTLIGKLIGRKAWPPTTNKKYKSS